MGVEGSSPTVASYPPRSSVVVVVVVVKVRDDETKPVAAATQPQQKANENATTNDRIPIHIYRKFVSSQAMVGSGCWCLTVIPLERRRRHAGVR
jgi:hypothetical protein